MKRKKLLRHNFQVTWIIKFSELVQMMMNDYATGRGFMSWTLIELKKNKGWQW